MTRVPRTQVRLIAHGTPIRPFSEVATTMPAGESLTSHGRQLALYLGALWRTEGVRIQEFHTSPLTASVETARAARSTYTPNMLVPPTIVNSLDTRSMYQRAQGLGNVAGRWTPTGVLANTAPGTELVGRELAGRQQDPRAQIGAALLASYLTSQRSTNPRESVVAVTDGGSINAMLSLLELGIKTAVQNPNALLARTIERPALDPGSETLIVLAGGPDLQSVGGEVVYVGAPPREDMLQA